MRFTIKVDFLKFPIYRVYREWERPPTSETPSHISKFSLLYMVMPSNQ